MDEAIDFLQQYLQLSQSLWELRDADEKPLWAWVAGILDGEGSIWFTKVKPQVSLAVRNTDKKMLVRLREITGVGTLHGAYSGGPRDKPHYAWHCASRKAQYVLRLCLPWLVTKQQQALLALALGELLRVGHNKYKGLPSWNLAKRDALAEALTILNKKGR